MDALTGRHRVSDRQIGPGGDAISASRNVVWVANRTRREVLAVAAHAPQRVLRRIALPDVPVDVAADPRGGVWVGVITPRELGPGSVLHYDAAGRLVRRITVAAGLTSIVIARASVWVAEYSEPALLRIDRRTGQVHFGAQLIRAAGSLAYGGGCVWAGIPIEDNVVRKCPGRTPIFAAAGSRPEDLTYARGRVYVASRFEQTLVVIDPRKMKPVQRLPMPFNPFAVTSDRRHVWVTSLGQDSVTRVDLE